MIDNAFIITVDANIQDNISRSVRFLRNANKDKFALKHALILSSNALELSLYDFLRSRLGESKLKNKRGYTLSFTEQVELLFSQNLDYKKILLHAVGVPICFRKDEMAKMLEHRNTLVHCEICAEKTDVMKSVFQNFLYVNLLRPPENNIIRNLSPDDRANFVQLLESFERVELNNFLLIEDVETFDWKSKSETISFLDNNINHCEECNFNDRIICKADNCHCLICLQGGECHRLKYYCFFCGDQGHMCCCERCNIFLTDKDNHGFVVINEYSEGYCEACYDETFNTD